MFTAVSDNTRPRVKKKYAGIISRIILWCIIHHVLWCRILFAREVEQEGISVAISSLTASADDSELSKRATEVNNTLRKFCRQDDWGLTDNNNIVTKKHLIRSRLHLNRAGTSLLSQNLSTYINRHFTNVGHYLARGIPHVDTQPEHYFIPTDKTFSFKSCSANKV